MFIKAKRNGKKKKTVICDLGLIIKETLYLGGIYWRHADVDDSAFVMRVLFSLFLIDLIKREKVFLADEKRQSHFRPK